MIHPDFAMIAPVLYYHLVTWVFPGRFGKDETVSD